MGVVMNCAVVLGVWGLTAAGGLLKSRNSSTSLSPVVCFSDDGVLKLMVLPYVGTSLETVPVPPVVANGGSTTSSSCASSSSSSCASSSCGGDLLGVLLATCLVIGSALDLPKLCVVCLKTRGGGFCVFTPLAFVLCFCFGLSGLFINIETRTLSERVGGVTGAPMGITSMDLTILLVCISLSGGEEDEQ